MRRLMFWRSLLMRWRTADADYKAARAQAEGAEKRLRDRGEDREKTLMREIRRRED